MTEAVGEAEGLLVVQLDITSLASAEAAVQSAIERFGRIDVLVNNAGNFYAGFFDELTPEQVECQLTTNLIGPTNVTRAVLPVMRKQRSGHVVTITSTGGSWPGVLLGIFRLEVRARGLDGVAAVRGSSHSASEPRSWSLVSSATTYLKGVDDLRRAVDRRLRRAHRPDPTRLGGDEW